MPDTIRVICQACAQETEVDLQSPERIFDCPSCSNPIRIPDPEEIQERDDKAKEQADRSRTTITRGRRAILWVVCLTVTINAFYLFVLQSLPLPDVVENDHMRARAERPTKGVNAEYDQVRDRIYARDAGNDYGRQVMIQHGTTAGLLVANAMLLALVVASRKNWARGLCGFLNLVVPAISLALYFLPKGEIPHALSTSQKTTFLGITAGRLLVSFVAGYLLLGSKKIVAYTRMQGT